MTEKIQDVLVKIEAENKPYNHPDQDFYKKLVLNLFIDKAYPEIICWILTCICIEEKEIFDYWYFAINFFYSFIYCAKIFFFIL